VKLGYEELQAEVAEPCKEVRKPLLEKWMTISQPQESNYLEKQKQ
jgi:hypothetical protein